MIYRFNIANGFEIFIYTWIVLSRQQKTDMFCKSKFYMIKGSGNIYYLI